MDWKAYAAQKRNSILQLIPPAWKLSVAVPSPSEQKDVTGKYIQQFLTTKEITITETDAVGIVQKTTLGQWSAQEVTEAFCHRAALAHQLVNCLHEIFFAAAIADAKKLDQYFASHGKPKGPLHGLPVSLKDQFHVKDVETTMGYVGWIGTFEGKKGTGKEKVFESEMVTELRDLGAVLFCKTSVPHTLMAGETMNNIIEYTWNPKNRFLACGGSSGGEGALLGLKGSPIGMGTDIGGSIRIPAAFNGLYGIRPSHGRLPYEGVANSMDGQNSILSVVGPLATSAGALRLLIRGILSRDPWLHDPLVAEIPWRHEHEQFILDIARAGSKKQMCFAVMKDDGIIHPHPPIRRAIEMVISVIEKLGHRTITWAPPSHQEGIDIAGKTFMFDGGTDVRAAFALSGEPMAPAIAQNYAKQSPEYTASQIAATNVQKRQFQKKYMEYWNSTSTITGTGRPVDAVISPLAPFAAAKRDTYDYYGMYGGAWYTTWVNLLDYTAAVLPVTTVDKEVDVVDEGYEPKSEQDEMIHKTYDPELFDGAHVGVQIVGRRFQEEKILTITEILGHALGRLVV